jgi:hypothetical protein
MKKNKKNILRADSKLPSTNPALTAVSLLAALSMTAAAVEGQPTNSTVPVTTTQDDVDNVDLLFKPTLFDRVIYANTYATLSAGTWTNGSLSSGAAATLGAGADVSGSVKTGAATTIGAGAKIGGNVVAQAAVTVGAAATIEGRLFASGAENKALPAQVKRNLICGFGPPIVDNLRFAQESFADLGTDWDVSPGDIAADQTFFSGVHNTAGSLSVSAGVKLTLDCSANDNYSANNELEQNPRYTSKHHGYRPDVFIFNIAGHLSVGANVEVIVLGADENTRIVWNITGTYVSIGADTDFKGRILAKGYISTGANVTIQSVGGEVEETPAVCHRDKDGTEISTTDHGPDGTVRSIGGSGSGAYSQTAYVCLGAGAKVGHRADDPVHGTDKK